MRPTSAAGCRSDGAAPGRIPVVALHDAAVARIANDRAVDVVPRAAIAAQEAVRVRVHEFRFVPGDRRALGVGEAAIHRQRRGFRFAAERDGLLDGQLPRVVQVEIRDDAGEPVRIRETGGGVFRREAGDGERLADGGMHGVRREIGGARMAAALPEIDGHADALVAVVRDSLDFAAAHGDALADRLRDVGLRRGRAARLRRREHGLGDALDFGRGQRKATAIGAAREGDAVALARGGVGAGWAKAVIDGLCGEVAAKATRPRSGARLS